MSRVARSLCLVTWFGYLFVFARSASASIEQPPFAAELIGESIAEVDLFSKAAAQGGTCPGDDPADFGARGFGCEVGTGLSGGTQALSILLTPVILLCLRGGRRRS